MARKLALLIGVTAYSDDSGLAKLKAPAADLRALEKVLSDKQIGGYEVARLLNPRFDEARLAIDDFFADKAPDDLLLFYFSGHGVQDPQNRLYLAMKNSKRDRLRGTAIETLFIKDAMDTCRARQQVLLLDCCHSGLFAEGAKDAGVGKQTITDETFRGRGRVVLTATDKTQSAWEGDTIIGEIENSLFTHYVIEGLETGAADSPPDGLITPNELYEYVFKQVRSATSKQSPRRIVYDNEGDFVIALNPNPPKPPSATLPDHLIPAIVSPSPFVREGAAKELGELLKSPDKPLAQLARETLAKLLDDDSKKVSTLAAELLGAKPIADQQSPTPKPAAPEPKKESKSTPPPKTEPATPKLTTSYQSLATSDQLLKTIRLDIPFPLDLILIPAGEFLMGSDKTKDKDADDDELPQHKVYLPDYYIAKYPVTNAQWAVYAKAMKKKEVSPKGKETHPVVSVNWNEANEFCGRLNTILKGLARVGNPRSLIARLPTEAEWEKVARGTDGRIYPWGNDFDAKKCNVSESKIGGTTPVGKYSPQSDSPYGVADMSGNVWEWTNSKREKYPYKADDGREDGKGDRFVLRGGAWNLSEVDARCADRGIVPRDFQLTNSGFRVVVAFPVSRS